jgi:Icc-related predicted phosphoesterase
LKITHISDPHGKHHYINWGDIKDRTTDLLIVSGDISMAGRKEEVTDFFQWIYRFPATYKCLIAGNHDLCFDKQRGGNDGSRPTWLLELVYEFQRGGKNFYLENSSCEIEGIKLWGSPITPWFFGDTWAFNQHRGPEHIGKTWELIPEGTDIIITHGPPFEFGDFLPPDEMYPHGARVGCLELNNKLRQIKPSICMFGHIHEGYGVYKNPYTIFINGSVLNGSYYPVNKPWVFDFDIQTKKVTFEPSTGLGEDIPAGERTN